MNKVLKTLGVVAAASIATVSVAPAVMAYGDNSGQNGGRKTYTVSEINKGALGNTIVFNSIKDTDANALTQAQRDAGKILPLTDERAFVGVREDTGINAGAKNQWYNTINVEEGKEYIIRLYVHNNSPKGTAAIAKDVTTSFQLPTVVGTSQHVDGFITSSNASITKYWDSVNFTSDRNFYLDYVEGSALIESNGKVGGTTLSDSIIDGGVKIGYDKLDGNLPGCYQYAAYITIKVKPVFEDSSISKKVRIAGTSEWKDFVEAKVGDKVEYRLEYTNKTADTRYNVTLIDSLPDSLKYVAGSTTLKNATINNGTPDKDTLTTTGVNIGNYAVESNAIVKFTAEVVDNGLVCGTNRLINWVKASAAGYAVQDSADVYVTKTDGCNTPVNPETPTKPENNTTTTTTPSKTTTTTAAKLPTTGAEFAVGAVGIGSTVTAAGYYIASRKHLR